MEEEEGIYRDDEAELRAKNPDYRGIDWWIDQVRAEREARESPAA